MPHYVSVGITEKGSIELPQPRKKQDGPTITVKGREYSVNKDFTWRELITVEELSGMPLGRDDALDSMVVGAAFIFVVLKREDKDLTWETFIDRPLGDLNADEEPHTNGDGPAKRRPTKAAKAASSPSV